MANNTSSLYIGHSILKSVYSLKETGKRRLSIFLSFLKMMRYIVVIQWMSQNIKLNGRNHELREKWRNKFSPPTLLFMNEWWNGGGGGLGFSLLSKSWQRSCVVGEYCLKGRILCQQSISPQKYAISLEAWKEDKSLIQKQNYVRVKLKVQTLKVFNWNFIY